MLRRIECVRVSLTGRDPIEIGWGSRDLLLDEIAHLASSRAIRDCFEAVGASAPVQLTDEHKGDVLTAIDEWAKRLAGDIPEPIRELRDAITEDLGAYV